MSSVPSAAGNLPRGAGAGLPLRAQSIGRLQPRKFRILVCRGPECGERRGSRDVHDALAVAVPARGLGEVVTLGWQSCFGRCTQGPNVLVQEVAPPRPGERAFVLATMPLGRAGRSALYSGVTPADADAIVDDHILKDGLVSRLIEPPARAGAGYSRPASATTRQKPSEEGSEGES